MTVLSVLLDLKIFLHFISDGSGSQLQNDV